MSSGRTKVKPKIRSLFSAGKFRLVGLVMVFFAATAPLAMDLDFDRMRLLAEESFGSQGLQAVSAWEEFLLRASSLSVEDKISEVNDFFNRRVLYAEDLITWGQADYWATPLETLGLGRGDCEDFAFAKYVSLQRLGVPAERLRLTYVRAKILDSSRVTTRAHMVLGYYPSPESEPEILDSLILEIRPASQRKDLYPIFSFNTEQLWVSGRKAPAGGSSARLSHWRDVLSRMRDEGLR